MKIPEKQVASSHYGFRNYLTPNRWSSLWHQLEEVFRLEPASVLEIGPGPGLFKNIAVTMGLSVETLDLDPELLPDHVAPANDMPFADGSYDLVCAFQMLEHTPYATALEIFAEMSRVASRGMVISLPHARPMWAFTVHLPGRGPLDFLVPRPWSGPREHVFDGQHYWEVGTRGFALRRVIADLERVSRRSVTRSFRVHRNAYHVFLVFE